MKWNAKENENVHRNFNLNASQGSSCAIKRFQKKTEYFHIKQAKQHAPAHSTGSGIRGHVAKQHHKDSVLIGTHIAQLQGNLQPAQGAVGRLNKNKQMEVCKIIR